MAALQIVSVGGLGGVAGADETNRNQTPFALPRPGYEPQGFQLGRTLISPQLTIAETYDSNLFGQSSHEQDEFITEVQPRVRLTTSGKNLSLTSEAFAGASILAKNPGESQPTYGASVAPSLQLTPTQTIGGELSYIRRFETRAQDQELTRTDEFSPFQVGEGTFTYRWRRNRIGVEAAAGAQRTDFLDSEESDRDRWEYQGSVRGSFLLTPRFDSFVEGYVTRRKFDQEQSGGTVSDSTSGDLNAFIYGFYVGTKIDVADKWWGEVGVGLFYVNNDRSSADDFLGVGARSALTWSITPRTALSARVEREDAATTLSGASGRVITLAGLHLEQEVRHNILFGAEVGLVANQYEEGDQSDTLAPAAAISTQYLLNRTASLYVSAGYNQRFSDQPDDEFKRFLVTLGTRLRF